MINVIRSFFQTYKTSVCFCLLFCTVVSAVFLSFGGAIPVHIEKTVEDLVSRAPMSSPDVIVGPTDLYACRFRDDMITALAEYGELTLLSVLRTADSSGLPVLAVGMPQSALSESLSLIDGRLPQNENECVIVSCGSISQGFAVVGNTVSFDENETPLTIVGVAENIRGTLAVYEQRDYHPVVISAVSLTSAALSYAESTSTGYAAMVYTTDKASYTQNSRICELAAITLNDTAQMLSEQRLTELFTEKVTINQDEHVLEGYNEHSETIRVLSENLRTLQKQITAQEIRVQELENQLDIAVLKIEETENLLFDEMTTLQTKKQDFIAQMEINEYYSINQTTLIPRREREEEGYALHQKEIDSLTETLYSAYDERNAVNAALQTERKSLAEMEETSAEMEAYINLHSDVFISVIPGTSPKIKVTFRGQTQPELALKALAFGERRSHWQVAMVLLVLSAVLTLLFFVSVPCQKKLVREYLFSAAVFSLIGVVFGTCILPYASYQSVFAPLAKQIPLAVFHGSLIPTILLYWAISTVLAIASCVIGSLISAKTANKAAM